MGAPKMPNRRASKRVLKPVIEKKRRDRINQRLDELRTLLLDNTLDMRLQNPKLEKAEILELTVDYIRKKANFAKENKADSPDTVTPAVPAGKPRVPSISLHDPLQLQANSPLYTAGFRECVSRLASFMECVEPPQRDDFLQSLRHHLDSHSSRIPSHPWTSGTSEAFSYSNNHQLYPKPFLLHHPHTSAQPLSHSYPSPPYSLSPPPSPCYSSTSPPFSTSPTYLSVPCHFPFPPSVSPLSSDSSSSSTSSSFSTSPTYLSVPCHFPFPPSVSPPCSDPSSSLSSSSLSTSPTYLSAPIHFPFPPSVSPLSSESSNSSSSSSFTTSPTYLSVPCHFPFPPSVSPLSSDSSSSSSSSFTMSTPGVNIVAAPKPPAPTPLRPAAPVAPSCPSQRTLRRTLFQNQQQDMWRPW